MKTMKFNVWERIQLQNSIPQKGSVSEIRKHLRVLDLLEMSQEEKEAIGFVETRTMTPQGQATSFHWGNKKDGATLEPDHEFEITFEDADFAHLKVLVNSRSDWPTTHKVFALIDKFGRGDK